jgi:hypothetical protein
MPLSNAEKQARWRERHIGKRRAAQRIVNLLVRQDLTEKHVEEIASVLRQLLNQRGRQTLRRSLKERTTEEMDAINAADAKWFEDEWLRSHPGRTAAEYRRLLKDYDGEVWEWRRSLGRASNAAERQAWERDHPGEKLPEHLCSLNDREASDYERWKRQQQKRRRTAPTDAR